MTDNDIKLLRRLLAKYYDGQTTVDEECGIARMLQTSLGDSEEFAADRALFASLSGCFPAADRCPVVIPPGLGERLQEAVDRRFAMRKVSGVPRWMRAVACGAAAACMAGLVFMTVNVGGDDARLAECPPAETGVTEVVVKAPHACHMAFDASLIADSALCEVVVPPVAETPSAAVRQPRQRAVASTRQALPDPAPELLASAEVDDTTPGIDPLTAAAVSEAAFRVLAQAIAAAEKPIEQTATAVSEVNQTVNNIKITIK